MPANNNENRNDEYGNLIRPKFLSNHTHFSPTYPDPRISVKPGKARQLNYSGQLAVDDAHHVIVGTVVTHADKRDSQCLQQIVDHSITILLENEIPMGEICADTA